MSDIAISYDRLSDPKQTAGDGESRQQRAFAAFCERHKLKPAKHAFVDRGLSGYHGRHRTKGDMGRLEELAKAGAFPLGTVLVIEAWDRLGRMRPDKQTNFIADLLRTGLKIGIARLDDIFSEEDFGTHKWTTLSVFIQLAYQESKQKSERVAASWAQRKIRARKDGTVMTARLPAWLRIVDGKPQPIPERVAAIKRIFELAGAGYGQGKILKGLVREGVRPFGTKVVRPGRRRSQFAGRWVRRTIDLILSDRRVLGEHQPTKAPGRTPDGPPIPGYYPAIISQPEWDSAQAGAGHWRGNTGTRQRKHLNIFSGLIRNAIDGAGFALNNKGVKGRVDLHLITTANGNVTSFSYTILERAVLELLREIPPSELFPAPQHNAVDVLDARLKALQADIAGLTDDLRRRHSSAVSMVLGEKEDQARLVRDELQRAQAEVANPVADSWKEFRSLAELLDGADDKDDVRLRLQAALRRCVVSIVMLVTPRGRERAAFVQFEFAGGDRRVFVIWYRPVVSVMGRKRPGHWWAMSGVVREGTVVDLTTLEDQAFAERFVANWQEPEGSGAVASKHFIREDLPA